MDGRKNKKQFGIWMDTHHATIIGYAVARDCTSNKMSDERLVEFIRAKFNLD